jgi:hypothetical protein
MNDAAVHADAPLSPPSSPRFLLELEKRLSDSLRWTSERRFFHDRGIDAWRNDTVPHYVTNNPALARAYAAVALGFLRDLVAAGERFTAAEPFTLIELGAGTGRFAFFFLTAFRAQLRLSPFGDAPMRRRWSWWRGTVWRAGHFGRDGGENPLGRVPGPGETGATGTARGCAAFSPAGAGAGPQGRGGKRGGGFATVGQRLRGGGCMAARWPSRSASASRPGSCTTAMPEP